MNTIIADAREAKVIGKFVEKNIPHKTAQLDIGDFQIEINGKIEAIWERKTYSDLASSLKDSRYREQKHRLIVSDILIKGYILEGHYPTGEFQGLQEGTIDSILMGLAVRDGFKLLYSNGPAHTAQILAKMLRKFPEYQISNENIADSYRLALVQGSISTIKKENYTPEICYLSQLAQIPQISYVTAKSIAEAYPNMIELINIVKSPPALQTLSQVQVGGRRIGKKIAQNIITYIKGPVVLPEIITNQPLKPVEEPLDKCKPIKISIKKRLNADNI